MEKKTFKPKKQGLLRKKSPKVIFERSGNKIIITEKDLEESFDGH